MHQHEVYFCQESLFVIKNNIAKMDESLYINIFFNLLLYLKPNHEISFLVLAYKNCTEMFFMFEFRKNIFYVQLRTIF